MTDKNMKMAKKIAEAVSAAGGRTFLVGGYVRDQFLGRPNKDIDIEVHGIPVPVLTGILDDLGECLLVGESFGILGLRGYEVDIAMPRSEKAAGRGHKDFEVSVDPFIGPEKAALRRDFTMNALMQDVLTGEILDFFGGIDDLRERRIRHVNDQTFREDPLRVYRAAQFAARFGFTIAPETVTLSAGIDVTALSGERIMTELEKALLKAERPSVFFESLRKMDQLSVWFPEEEALIGILQDPIRHPEGDVWTHTMQVVDAAAGLRDQAEKPLWFMLAALCHDFGKKDTTLVTDSGIHSYGHEEAGCLPAQRFLQRITAEVKLLDYVMNMIRLHMEPNKKVRDGAHRKSFMKMFDRSVCPDDLVLLAEADALGRLAPGADENTAAAEYRETGSVIRELLAEYKELMSRPYLMGRDLIEAGIGPGPLMGEALAFAHKLRLAGLPKEEQMRQTLGFIRTRECRKSKKQSPPSGRRIRK